MAASNPYAPQAAHVAAQYGIPKGLFLSLVHQESGFNPQAKSSAGAFGLTQLMPATARAMNVNLQDPMSQLEGGARYLKQQYDKFGNWQLALAAYNAGPGNVTNGAWKNFPETQNYVKNILGSEGDYGGTQPPQPAPITPGTVSTQPSTPVETPTLNANAFAADELSHLGDPGHALQGLATGAFSNQLRSLATAAPTQHSDVHAAGGALLGKAIVKTAMTQLNIPYQWGGRPGLGNHTDCSGLVQEVMAAHGISVPRTTYQQWRTGKPVPLNAMQPGDAVFFHDTNAGPSHVGIYIGGGKFINDPHTGAAVRISPLAGYPGFVGARRFTGAK